MQKPSEDDLYDHKEAYGKLENLVPDHPLNTEEYKRKLLNKDDVSAFCLFSMSDDDRTIEFMFTGYMDGLICCWDIDSLQSSV